MRATAIRTVLPLVLTAATLAIAGQAAQGREPASSSSQAEVLSISEWQEKVRGAKEELLTIAREDSGFTGARFDNTNRELVILLATPPSERLNDAMARLAEALPSSVESADYSEAELAEAAAVVDDLAGVHTVEFELDFSGLVAKTGSNSSPSEVERGAARVTSRLAQEDDSTSPIPVRVVRAAPILNAIDRGSGTAPFRGGSRINVPAGICSTGFRVYQNGNGKMLTAWHCFQNANTAGGLVGHVARQSGDNQQVGTSANAAQAAWDVQAIDGQSYTNGTWVGDAPVSGAYTLNYVTTGTGELVQNELVCISGAWSGKGCGMTGVMWANRQACTQTGTNCVNQVGGIFLLDDQAIAGTGDSGSPAYQSAGGTSLAAAGLLSGGDVSLQYLSPCAGIAANRTCSRRVVITPWFRFRTQFTPNLTLNP